MADAEPTSFTKQIIIQDEEVTITTNDGTETTGIVKSDGTIENIIKLTQAEYDAIVPKDAETLYVIIG